MPPKQKKVEEVMCLQVVVIDTPFNQEMQLRLDRIGSLLYFPVQELKGVATDQFIKDQLIRVNLKVCMVTSILTDVKVKSPKPIKEVPRLVIARLFNSILI